MQEGFNLILYTEMLQIVHSLSLLAPAVSRCVAELLGSGNTFFFGTKGGFVVFALCPNGKALRGRKRKLPTPGAPHS